MTGSASSIAFDYAPAELAFQDPERPGAESPAAAKAVVIPFGLEASVSYGTGTAKGPAAILAASQQLEIFDEELRVDPSRFFAVATLHEPAKAHGLEMALDQLESVVEGIVASGRFPLVLGGEHALTAAAVRPFARRAEGTGHLTGRCTCRFARRLSGPSLFARLSDAPRSRSRQLPPGLPRPACRFGRGMALHRGAPRACHRVLGA